MEVQKFEKRTCPKKVLTQSKEQRREKQVKKEIQRRPQTRTVAAPRSTDFLPRILTVCTNRGLHPDNGKYCIVLLGTK